MRRSAGHWPAVTAWLKENPEIGYAGVSEHFMPDYIAANGPYPFATLDDESPIGTVRRLLGLTAAENSGDRSGCFCGHQADESA